MNNESFLTFFVLFFLLRFILIFMVPFFVFEKIKPSWAIPYKIQLTDRPTMSWVNEAKYSLMTLVIQAALVYFILQSGYFSVYEGFLARGWGYLILSFVLYFLIYDFYFYISHRFLHLKWFYVNIHRTHHQSLRPNALSSYSFHPIEAFINVLYLVPVLYFLPMSWELLMVIFVLSDIGNLAGHIGYDFIPNWKIFKMTLTTPTHHNIHHQVPNSNFGLYWRGCDVFFGTMNSKTDEEFLRVKNQKLFL